VRNNKNIMSESLRKKIAQELGIYNTVKNEGWGAVSSKNCGYMVRKAIEIANKNYQQ